MVDAVIYFEGDSDAHFRIVRSIKNRFGTINEIGIFSMTNRGLKEITNPSALFLTDSKFSDKKKRKVKEFNPGTCVFPSQEGTRPLLLEIQALVDNNNVSNPRRFSLGLDAQRLCMLIAVLHKHCNITCRDQDIYVNAVGGIKIQEPSSDLPIILSLISSIRSKPLPAGLVAFGEVGLSGEIRATPKGIERLKESEKLGFGNAIIPMANISKLNLLKINTIGIDHISEINKIID